MSPIDEILSLYEVKGATVRSGETLTEIEHALHTAALAEAEPVVDDALVVAALVHDIGYLLDDTATREDQTGCDGRHEQTGAAWLARFFGPEITEPVRLHVEAKRYLCALEPAYLDGLSQGSAARLELQGGPFSRRELRDFQMNPYHVQALRLRCLDDLASIPARHVPGLQRYRPRLEKALLSGDLEREPRLLLAESA